MCGGKCAVGRACNTVLDCVSGATMSCYSGKCSNTNYLSSVALAANSDVIVTGVGFNTSKPFRCIFFNNTRNITVAFNASSAVSSSSLNCGPSPTAPGSTSPLKSNTYVAFNVSVFEVVSPSNVTGFQFPSVIPAQFEYTPCANGVVDNVETGEIYLNQLH